MTIGKRLREERERLGYSQPDFAALGGKTKKTQIEWEADKATPNAAFLAEVELAGVDVLYVLAGRRETPLADGYHQESADGVDAVLERMFEAVGKPLGLGYAKAFDVSERTLAAWRARGRVARSYLDGFAREYEKSVDWLLHGDQPAAAPRPVNQSVQPYGLSADEAALLSAYRRSAPEAQAVVLRALGAAAPSKPAPPQAEKSRRTIERPSAREFGPDPNRRSQPRVFGGDEDPESARRARGKK